jgi:hypothetical protein
MVAIIAAAWLAGGRYWAENGTKSTTVTVAQKPKVSPPPEKTTEPVEIRESPEPETEPVAPIAATPKQDGDPDEREVGQVVQSEQVVGHTRIKPEAETGHVVKPEDVVGRTETRPEPETAKEPSQTTTADEQEEGHVEDTTAPTASSEPGSDLEAEITQSPPAVPSLAGSIDVRFYRRGIGATFSLIPFGTDALRAVRKNDVVAVEVQLAQPAYVYVFWIDEEGKVAPVYPWEPGVWGRRPVENSVDTIALPQAGYGWPLTDSSDKQAIVVVARKDRLPDEFDLKQMLGELPTHEFRSFGWFKNGELSIEQTDVIRGPQFHEARKINDPVHLILPQDHLKLKGQIDLTCLDDCACSVVVLDVKPPIRGLLRGEPPRKKIKERRSKRRNDE